VQTQTPTQSGAGGSQPSATGGPQWGLAALIVAAGLVVFFGVTRWFLAQPAATPGVSTPVATAAAPIAVALAPTPARTAAAVAALAAVPTATLRPVATATLQAVRTAPPATVPAPTAVPTLAEEWWTRTSIGVDPAQAQLVVSALDEYWAVLTPAWRTLDTSHLDQVLTEPRLSQESQIFADERSQGRGIDVKVDRGSHQVRDLRPTEAVVYEEYVNHGLEIDLKTGTAIGEAKPEQVAVSYLFRRTAPGEWKVAEVVGHDSQ
jgi:hypothetical protein